VNFRHFAVLVLLIASTANASASSFPRDPGTSFVDFQYSNYESGTFINPAGTYSPSGCTFDKIELNAYAEYGLTKRDTITGQLPYDWINCGGNATRGFTDLELADNHNLHRGATTTFGVRVDAIVPMGYSIAVNPRLGYGRVGTEDDVLYGGSIGRNGFYDTQAGFRVYSGYPAPEFHTTGTLGYNTKPALVLGQLDYVTNVGSGTILTNIGQNPTIQTTYTALQGTVGATFHLAPATSFYVGTTTVLYGRNTGQGHSISIGYWGTF